MRVFPDPAPAITRAAPRGELTAAPDRFQDLAEAHSVAPDKGLTGSYEEAGLPEGIRTALAGLEEGLFPLSRALESEGGLEEERRLFYVGVTRAMDALFLTYADQRWRAGMESRSAPRLA